MYGPEGGTPLTQRKVEFRVEGSLEGTNIVLRTKTGGVEGERKYDG